MFCFRRQIESSMCLGELEGEVSSPGDPENLGTVH